MEDGRQKALDYFSSDEGKKAIKSVQITFGKSKQSFQKSIPKFEDLNTAISHFPNSFDSVERIRKLNEESNGMNEQIVKSLAEEQDEIKALKSELKEAKESHKHDILKQFLITLLGCVFSFLLGHFLP